MAPRLLALSGEEIEVELSDAQSMKDVRLAVLRPRSTCEPVFRGEPEWRGSGAASPRVCS